MIGPNETQNLTSTNSQLVLSCNNGGTINVEATASVIMVSGQCSAIGIKGDGNNLRAAGLGTLTVDWSANYISAESIVKATTKGNGNRVVARTLTEVSVSGTANSVVVGNISTVGIDGQGNLVEYFGSRPRVNVQGTANSVVPG